MTDYNFTTIKNMSLILIEQIYFNKIEINATNVANSDFIEETSKNIPVNSKVRSYMLTL